MSPTPRRALCSLVLALVVAPAGCGGPTPPPTLPIAAPSASVVASVAAPVAAEAPEGPVPKPRSGALARIDHPQVIEGQVTGRFVDATFETLAVDLTLPSAVPSGMWGSASGVVVSLGGVGPYAFVSFTGRDDFPSRGDNPGSHASTPLTVWIRRPRAHQDLPITGALFVAHDGGDPGDRFVFHAPVDPAKKSTPATLAQWGHALAGALRDRGSTPWHAFAAQRVEEVFVPKTKPAGKPGRPGGALREGRTDLMELMDTTTGAMSIQEALQMDRPLLLRAARDRASVPIGKLAGPKSAPHPWEELSRALGKTAPAEPLAALVPAEFYYLRAADLDVLFQLSDQLDAWATPIVDALDRRAAEQDLAGRYETQLGLARTALARALGKDVVAQVALVGSDPYLREGSDVSVIFQVKQRGLFEVGLASTLAARAREHGSVAAATTSYQGVDIRVATSPDGAVHQHRATVGDVEIVSNSPAAIRRIIEAIKGKRPRLADEKDFAYLMARDASVRADALGFMGDRFVGEVVGPRQKVLESRRQIALAELMTPGFAALLHGWITGRSATSVEELLASKLLTKDELKHGSGAPIAWKPGDSARSVFGTPAALTPLLDLPDPDLVTEGERDAYARFSRSYETYWRTYIDPAAMRVAVDTTPAGTTLTADLRIVPLIDGTDYREILETAGQARVEVPALGSGARAVVGIGQEARVRRELAHLVRGFAGKHDFGLDFLGDWAMIGIDDRPAVAQAVFASQRDLPELPGGEERKHTDEIAALATVPAYVAIGIKSMAGAALALAAMHGISDDVLPGAITWAEKGKERDVGIVRIAVAEDLGRGRDEAAAGESVKPKDLEIYYALTRGVFLASFNGRTLRRLVDDVLDGHGPTPATASAGGSQLVVDLAGEKQGALFTVISWLLTEESRTGDRLSRELAEAWLVGAQDLGGDPAAIRARAIATLGCMPVPPEGGQWTLGDDGVRDPQRGSASAPIWPELPVAGSPTERLLSAVGRFRSEIAFDREGSSKGKGGLLSLHARVALGLRR
ncbi:MAG: hypothetical protein ABJE95_36800 [Byssovorax sp.]